MAVTPRVANLHDFASHLQSSPPHLLAPSREAAPKSSPMSRHFLLPRGRLPDGSPLWPPHEHSITAMSFDSSLRRSLAPSTNGPPHHCCSPAARVTPSWMAPASEAPTTRTPIVNSSHLCGPPGPLSGSPRCRHGRSGRVTTGATLPCSGWASRPDGRQLRQPRRMVEWAGLKASPHEQCPLSFS
jgi:hypothetical protein